MAVETSIGVCPPVVQFRIIDPATLTFELNDLFALVNDDGEFIIDNEIDCTFIVEG